MLELLRNTVDAAAITSDTARFTLHGVEPGSVVEPGSSEEAAAVLKLASEQDWRVECAGGGTQVYGNRRTRADIILSTRRLTNVVEYEPNDLVIGAQSGMSLATLARTTEQHGQFFAQDPAANEKSTIGGALATARSGPLRLTQGTPRDHALGLEIVTGDGRILRLGGRVVKNVAGYDLVRLLVGSGGTLGLITSAYLRLKPIPQADETVVLAAHSAEPLLEISEYIISEMLEAAAIELIGPGILGSDWTLLVRLSGNGESVADARARIAERSPRLESAQPQVWHMLQEVELDATTAIRLADLPTRLAATLQLAEKLVTRAGVPAKTMAHAGDGIVRLYFAETDQEALAFAIGEARSVMGVSGGTVVAHSRDGELMRRVDAFGAVGPAQFLMTRLKQIFDPAGVLAPGRFVT
jgi:glycolate oxidase FAD binding subunit